MAVNQVTGARYIGATSVGLRKRQRQHVRDALSGSDCCGKFYRAIRKYGPGSFKWLIIATAKAPKLMFEAEIRLIAQLKPELNITRGGQGIVGLKRTKKWCRKVSKALKGRKPHPSCFEALRKLNSSFNFKSVVCLQDGKFFESVKSAAQYYSAPSIGEVLAGRQNYTAGKSFVYADAPLPEDVRLAYIRDSEERARQKLVKRRAKPVICLDDMKEYESGRAAAAAYGLKPGDISWACRFGRSANTNLHFVFKSELAK